jgi:uncharacterized membrane protein YbaN (DUF454 family)
MGALVPFFAAVSIGATVIWLIVRIVNHRPFAAGVILLLPLLATVVLFSDLRGEFLATLNRVMPWLLLGGGTIALLCSVLVYQAYIDLVTRILHSERFSRWTEWTCGPSWVEKAHSEWKKWEVVTPAHLRINICGSLLFIAAAAVWLALR